MYEGKTYQIPCERGGFDHNKNIDTIAPESMIDGSKNINFHKGARGKRGGTAKYNSTAISGNPDVMGLYNFKMEDGTNYLVVGASDGTTWYSDLGGAATLVAIDTGLATDAYFKFEVMDNALYMAIEGSTPRTWAGTGTSTAMTDIPADWLGVVFPKQFIKHGYGASERMWALGFVSGYCYYSKDADGDDFNDADSGQIVINTGDGTGIVGGFEFGDRLFVCGKNQIYIIDDTDVDDAKWGYMNTQWTGGVAHHRLIVKTPNDVVLMDETGEIYSVSAAENYGDYQQASLTRPAHIDNWIRETLALNYISKFHGCYDPVLRAIKFFVVTKGQTECNTALVYFIDRPPTEAWMIHDNTAYASGYSACSSALVNQTVGEYEMWTGDYNGFVWKLEQSTLSDAGNAYMGRFKTAPLNFGDARSFKHYHALRLVLQPQGNYDLNVNWWVDDVQQASGAITQAASGVALNTFLLDTDLLAGTTLQDSSMQLGRIGKRIQFQIYDNVATQDFFISQLLVDFKPLGGRDD